MEAELAGQPLGETRMVQQLVEAQGQGDEEGKAANDVLLLRGGRDEVAVLYGYYQTDKLPEEEEQRAATEHETVADTAVNEIDHHVVYGSGGQRYARSDEAEGVVEPPDEHSEKDVVNNLQHHEGYAVPFGKDAIGHRQRHATQERIEGRKGCHPRDCEKLVFVEQLEHERHEHDKQDKKGAEDERTNVYLLVDGVVHAHPIVVDGGEPREVVGLHSREHHTRIGNRNHISRIVETKYIQVGCHIQP